MEVLWLGLWLGRGERASEGGAHMSYLEPAVPGAHCKLSARVDDVHPVVGMPHRPAGRCSPAGRPGVRDSYEHEIRNPEITSYKTVGYPATPQLPLPGLP